MFVEIETYYECSVFYFVPVIRFYELIDKLYASVLQD